MVKHSLSTSLCVYEALPLPLTQLNGARDNIRPTSGDAASAIRAVFGDTCDELGELKLPSARQFRLHPRMDQKPSRL